MRPRHCSHIYWFAIFILLRPTVPLIVSETVLDTDNNPIVGTSARHTILTVEEGGRSTEPDVLGRLAIDL